VLRAILNIPQPPASFNIYNKTAGSALAEVSVNSMMQTARRTVAENEENDLSHITACFDGSWQKCGHISMHGIISATSSDKEEVLHIEIIKSFILFVTQIQPLGKLVSVKRAMKEQGLEQSCLCTLHFSSDLRFRGICYTKYLGIGAAERTKWWLQGSPMIQTYL
jgi:hypothetical protein